MKVMHKLLLLSVLPFLVILFSIIFVSKHQSESILRQRIMEAVNLELTIHSNQIEAFFHKKIDELKMIGSTPVVNKGSIPEILSYFEREQKRLSRYIEGIYYNDLDGTVYDVSGATFSVRDRYYFPEIARGKVVITKVIKSRATENPIVLVLVPIFDTNGKRTGAVGGTILVKDLLEMVMDIKVGKSGYAILVDEDNRVISAFGKQRHLVNEQFSELANSAVSTEGMEQIIKDIRNQSHHSNRVVYDHSSFLAFFKPIETTRWSLVFMHKESEVLADLKRMNTLYVLMCFLGGMAICLFVYGTKRIVLDPIKTLVRVQQQFGEGNLSVRSKNVSQDEFGALSLSFNEMADQLSKRTIELTDSEERYRMLFNSTHDAILVHQPSAEGEPRKFIEVNDIACKMYGYTRQEMLKLSPLDLVIHKQAVKYRMWVKRLFSEKHCVYEIIHKTHVGEEISVEISAHLFEFQDQPTVLCLVRDITQRKQVEKQLQQSQKLEAIGTLAGGIAHDFNNILSPLLGYSEMLMYDIADDSPLQTSVNEIYRASLRARDLVQQILAFSRQAEDDPKPIKVHPVVKEALKLIRASLPKTINIEQQIDPDCGAVISDPTQIHQIVMNLVTNAYHAMEDTGGTLTVILQQIRIESNPSEFIGLKSGTYACLTVKDTGIGIERDNFEKIFNPYFTTKGKDKGTGLGLSVVHGIVKSYGGDIQIFSEAGKGTEAYVYLPVVESKIEHRAREVGNIISEGTERILLVDDEEAIVRLEQQMLERLGYQVVTRTASFDALEAFKANPDRYDLIVTDMTMPNMTGDKLSEEIKKIRPEIPVIICTGFSEKIDGEKCKALGIQGYVMKPIVRNEFAGTIREVIDNTSQ